ncbi:TPA: phage anti-RecBCD protein [Salmonella enterica]
MSSPLNGAVSPCRLSGCTKDEVLANFARYYEKKDEIPMESKDERFSRYADEYKDRLMKERIYQTSIRPFRKATYTQFIEIDPRLRNYRSRYGAISNN